MEVRTIQSILKCLNMQAGNAAYGKWKGKNKVKACPKCRRHIEKNGGCVPNACLHNMDSRARSSVVRVSTNDRADTTTTTQLQPHALHQVPDGLVLGLRQVVHRCGPLRVPQQFLLPRLSLRGARHAGATGAGRYDVLNWLRCVAGGEREDYGCDDALSSPCGGLGGEGRGESYGLLYSIKPINRMEDRVIKRPP